MLYKQNQLQNHITNFLKLNIKLKSISLLRLFINKQKKIWIGKKMITLDFLTPQD